MRKIANGIGFLAACLALWSCQENATGPGEMPAVDSTVVFFPRAGHDYLYLSRRTHPVYGAPAVEACSVWSRHARASYTPPDAQDTIFRVREHRACYRTSIAGGWGDKSSDSLRIYYIAKTASSTRNYDTASGLANLQAGPPFDATAEKLPQPRKVFFYGDSLAVLGGTQNDLWLEGMGRLLYLRTYHGPFQNTYGTFEELRLLRYDSLEVTDSLITSYMNP